MRLHTNMLRDTDLYVILDEVRHAKAPDIRILFASVRASRSHQRAYEVTLRGFGDRHRKWPHAGNDGLGRAATYDDWGWFIALVFDRDPLAKVGPYADRADFHHKTNHKFDLRYA